MQTQQGLVPIEPFSISQPEPIYDGKVGALLPAKYRSSAITQ
nr:hypothetical protein [Providencia sp. G1(2023)]